MTVKKVTRWMIARRFRLAFAFTLILMVTALTASTLHPDVPDPEVQAILDRSWHRMLLEPTTILGLAVFLAAGTIFFGREIPKMFKDDQVGD